jgi:RecB family exonuclease
MEWLSKSQIKIFEQCPMKWKFLYRDKISSISSPQQNRGIEIHKKVEEFYKKIKIVDNKIQYKEAKDLQKFVEFENQRLKDCPELKYFNPIFQELKVSNPDMMLRGIIDAVYINPKDNKIILIDWKTGTPSGDMDDYRLELAIYKILFDTDKRVKEMGEFDVGYWGIFFLDKGKLFFEPIEQKWVDKANKIINKVREDIDFGVYKMKPSFWCKWCQFNTKDKCGGNNVNI